jgi:hypothetical protein
VAPERSCTMMQRRWIGWICGGLLCKSYHTVCSSSVSDSFCAQELGPQKHVADTDSTQSSGCVVLQGFQGFPQTGSVRKRVSYGILSASLAREVRAGTVCGSVLFPSSHGGHRLDFSRKVESRASLESAESLRLYGNKGADQTVGLVFWFVPFPGDGTWIWTRATDCLVLVRPIYQPQTSIAGPL